MQVVLFNRKKGSSITAAHTIWLNSDVGCRFFVTTTKFEDASTIQELLNMLSNCTDNNYRPGVDCASSFPDNHEEINLYLAGVKLEDIVPHVWKTSFKTVTLVDSTGKETLL